jgi:hypothetical protein
MEVIKMIKKPYNPVNIESDEIKQARKDIDDLSQAASALFRIPVFFSHQNLFTLGPPQPPLSKEQKFIIRMFKEIKKVLLFPRTVPNTDQKTSVR